MSFAYQLPRKCVQNKKRKHTKRQVLRKIIQKVFEHFDFECAYCGNEAESVDHIIPRLRGGDNSPNNLVTACIDCNQAKGTKFIELWYTEKNHLSQFPDTALRQGFEICHIAKSLETSVVKPKIK